MVAARVANIGWRLRRVGRGLDWTVTLALGLAAFGAAFYFSTVASAIAHTTGLRERIAQLRAVNAQAPEQAAVRDPVADLAAFYGALAESQKIPDMLRRLHRVAADQGLLVEQASYRAVADPDGRLVRYQILLPARGSYPEVRGFLAQATRQLPALAVDGVTFQRQQVGEQTLEAQLKLTLFVQGAATEIAK